MICRSCGTEVDPGTEACPRCGRPFTTPPSVDLSLAGPRPQRRLTVFFRWILAIPHLLYLAVLGLVAFVAVVVGWFASLVLGRLPDGLRLFLGRVLNHYVRVYGYSLFLLTDRYPPFALDDWDHDVATLLHPPTRLNRAAVLVRLVLWIPAAVVVQLLSTGVTVVMFFVWVVVLVKGHMPQAAFLAMAAILRYEARAYAYLMLLTPEYPRGLFGDKPPTGPVEVEEPAPVLGGPPPRITRIVLTKAARRIVVLTLVVGVVFGVGVLVATAVLSSQSDQALGELEDAYGDLEVATNDFIAQSQSCALSGGPECLQAEVARFADELDVFLVELRDIEMPGGALPYAQDVEAEGEAMLRSLDGMAGATSEEEYLSHAQVFQDHALAFDDAYAQLYDVLYFS